MGGDASTGSLVAIGGQSSSAAQPAIVLVSQNTIALNCSTMTARDDAPARPRPSFLLCLSRAQVNCLTRLLPPPPPRIAPQAYALATVNVRFWTATVPADSAVITPNATSNCGVDRTTACSGPVLWTNFNIAMLTPFMAQFTSGALLFAYPVRGSIGYTAVKNLVNSAGAVSPTATIADMNANPALVSAMCSACGAAMI